ncbi:ADP-ribose glycohydrolase MACROD2-like isoform X2 [Haliotis rufescens]|uniref:ADP-ribose glycohydrolase MACROD2-like isoform X2 n=1 Tax=Haliotis rufescens TaxID=6454 RepID=UPI00201F528A|nr:ADP-ribose glycohydrolase MACROD2-like isoform X2 [Haliotis rufescens]
MNARSLSGFLTKSFAGRKTRSAFELYLNNPCSHRNVNLVQSSKPQQRNFSHLVSEMSKKGATSKQTKLPFTTQPAKNMSSQNAGTGGGGSSKKEPPRKPDGGVERKITRQFVQKDDKAEVETDRENALGMSIEEKRKQYKCRDRYELLSNIPSWKNQPELSSATLPKKKKGFLSKDKACKKVYEVRPDLNEKVSLWCGDITTLEIDAIANAANEGLLGGGGVDGAIHSAAGPKLKKECKLLKGCRPGDAKITAGYELPARYVIHTVGPVTTSPETLESCYVQSLTRMKENKLKTIAFPCISTGIYGYPNEKAAPIAMRVVRDWLENDPYGPEVERVIFCLFLDIDVELYKEGMNTFFPLGDSNSGGETAEGAVSDEAKGTKDDDVSVTDEATATTVDEVDVSDNSKEPKNESMEVDDTGNTAKEKGDNSKASKGNENDIEMKNDQSESQEASIDDKVDDDTQETAKGKDGGKVSAEESKGDKSSREKKSVSAKKESADGDGDGDGARDKSPSEGSKESESATKTKSCHL